MQVSLFAELFNEMLMRDFGFEIYKHLARMVDKTAAAKDAKDKKEKEAEKKEGANADASQGEKSKEEEKEDSGVSSQEKRVLHCICHF